MRTESSPHPIYLKDYRQPDFWISEVRLRFELGEESTRVHSQIQLERNGTSDSPLVLLGETLKLISVSVDGRKLADTEYSNDDSTLTIQKVPSRFVLEIENDLEPQNNLSCEGLYKSKGMFCTQCEAESFRRITYFLDRPDVMSVYTVTIQADKQRYPVLLSNGNLVSRRELANGRHEAVWHDPHKKPCYLFALVAGDLGVLRDSFVTLSGRNVALEIYTRRGLEDRCRHAMDSLKWAMKWDEETYGLEYDLDVYMIVVAEDFNMGAMENKGLNIFNASYVLANPETATDHDFEAVMAVVAHEYFHNWTGNRVTCRDWFQLSLKEGLTVFRDQRFSADMTSEAVNRIEEVIRLRTHQFAEDSGPMAHPVRPQSYIAINNFYTLTVYEKGAEVIRMIETIVGRAGFRKGMDLYFKRHDGQAVTTEDFVAAMADANHIDLTQFKNWYDQAGTPVIRVSASHDPKQQLYSVTVAQSCPATPGQNEKKPYHIPIAVGLLGSDGRDLPLQLADEKGARSSPVDQSDRTIVLHAREPQQTFVFKNVSERPVLSLLRGFSAPVRAEYDATDDDLAFVMAHDSDFYCRWEAAQNLTVRLAKEFVNELEAGRPLGAPIRLTQAFAPLLADSKADPAFVSFMLALPAEQYLAQFFKVVDIDAMHAVREHMVRAIGSVHRAWFEKTYLDLARQGTDGHTPHAAGLRSLKNRALEYLLLSDDEQDLQLAVKQRREARNMTDELGALEALNRTANPARTLAMKEFFEKWKTEPLVVNKWLMMEAISPLVDTLERVRNLALSPAFDKNNPNKIQSLFGAFSRFNMVQFHDPRGHGYRFLVDQVLDIDTRNPQIAARLVAGFGQWRTLDQNRQVLIKAELTRVLAQPGLSSNVFELATKMLEAR